MNTTRLFGALLLILAAMSRPAPAADVLSVPIRWCVIGDDANGNGRADAGEQGAPAFTNPGHVGEVDTDNVLWRRHERPSDAVFIPEAQITFRSGIYNIVEDATLRFPIIPDPDPNPTGDSFWLYGDILSQSGAVSFEWNAAHNACVDAWREQHGVEDIGIVVINANHYRGLGGDSEPGAAVAGGRRMILRDNAYLLPGSPLYGAFETPPDLSTVGDHVDKHFGHEVGHALGNLRHTCALNVNIMSNRRQDTTGDNRVDNIHLSTSIAEVTDAGSNGVECTGGDDSTNTVNQIQLLRTAAQATAGCKVAGTNTDCTSHSDIRADRIKDAPLPFVDLSTFTASNGAGVTRLAHEPMGPLDPKRFIGRDQHLDYYSFIDQDQSAATGGEVSLLGVPIDFRGAELATRVRIGFDQTGRLSVTPTVWRFETGAFREVVDRRIRAFLFPLRAISTLRQVHLSDQVTLEMPTEIFGAGVVGFRLQAAIVSAGRETTVLDLLDEDREQPGRTFRWRSPEFPVCSVAPDPSPRLGAITVQSKGLLPNRPVHLIFGDRHVANGHAAADGTVSISTAIPAHATDGPHLITVGTDGTALTADCIANVRGGPPPPDGGGGDSVKSFEYPAKLVCGLQKDSNDLRLARGAYRTTINVRNPGPDSVTLTKDLALADPPGRQRPGETRRIATDVLPAGRALSVDCEDIARRLFEGRLPASYIDGWVVISSHRPLDVTSVHTVSAVDAQGRASDVRSIDVEPIVARPAARRGQKE